MNGHDGRELDERGAQGGHNRLPTVQLAAVGVVQQEEAVLPVMVNGAAVVFVATHRHRRWWPSIAAAVLVEHG